MMVDLHTHILPAIDDGADSTETSLDMLRIAQNDGITHLIVTPHYIDGSINNNAAVIKQSFEKLADTADNSGIDIHLYPGSEVFISPEVSDLAEKGEICTLNHSSYLLMELPMDSIPFYTMDVIYQLKLRGFTPVIAHPERYSAVMKDPNVLYEIIERGALCQTNATSINGIFGKTVSDTALTLLRHGMIHFISSDAHTCRGRSPKLSRARTVVAAELGEELAEALFTTNGMAVIRNEMIEAPEPQMVRRQKGFLLPYLRKLFTSGVK